MLGQAGQVDKSVKHFEDAFPSVLRVFMNYPVTVELYCLVELPEEVGEWVFADIDVFGVNNPGTPHKFVRHF